MLAEVLQLRRLHDELVDLANDVELLVGLEVATRELLVDAVEDLDGARVLALDLLDAVEDVAVDAGRAVGSGAGAGGGRGRGLGNGDVGVGVDVDVDVEEFRGGHVALEDGLTSSSSSDGRQGIFAL